MFWYSGRRRLKGNRDRAPQGVAVFCICGVEPMSEDEIKIVATAICEAHVKEGVGDWRAYKEIATSIIAGTDALDKVRKPRKATTPSVMATLSAVAPNAIPDPRPMILHTYEPINPDAGDEPTAIPNADLAAVGIPAPDEPAPPKAPKKGKKA